MASLDAWNEPALAPDRDTKGGWWRSEVDGFVTALAIGPETVPIDEWVSGLWGDPAPFRDAAARQRAIAALQDRFDDIVQALDGDSDAYVPLFWRTAEGVIVVENWAEGFLEGMRLRFAAWQPMFRDQEAGTFLFPMLIATADERELAKLQIPQAERDEVAANLPELIRLGVLAMDRFWKVRYLDSLVGSVRRERAKVGRNDPCPCGSGRKYKRCCAA